MYPTPCFSPFQTADSFIERSLCIITGWSEWLLPQIVRLYQQLSQDTVTFTYSL